MCTLDHIDHNNIVQISKHLYFSYSYLILVSNVFFFKLKKLIKQQKLVQSLVHLKLYTCIKLILN